MKLRQVVAVVTSILACTGEAQAPNSLGKYNPGLRSQSLNGIPTSQLATVVAPNKLVPLPTSDKSVFPNGFPAGTHPVVVLQGFGNDIRMQAANVPLFIKSLLTATVLVPYVDALKDGKTPFTLQVANYLSGVNGNDINTLVPVLVGALEGNPLRAATAGKFYALRITVPQSGQAAHRRSLADPNDKAYSIFQNSIYSSVIKNIIVPNPVSGPGVYADAIDVLFSSPPARGATSRIFHETLNFPVILPTPGMCQRNAYYFNDTFANPQLGKGTVTLYSPALPNGLTGSATGATAAKQYDGVAAYAAIGQLVGFNPEDCATASRNVDPFARSKY
ncbi:hypothetical protein FH972_023563 [Carpinus fangiana]|uniref:Cupin type-1 domain-containing protein n=1 Tax=Carpinus fangiana TaxID=176857 RepID=A0A5N6KVS9_9ROSI|nr:hypothetical protein FH972_023563 [Carpinus fangiana]